jgi:(1->4)-alpha-D-glucan 1-alpha-D-glucosylmutase
MRIPVATYRLQLNTTFQFGQAAALVDYLDGLGITDAYVSPLSMARAGSNHGYDVIDPGRLNPELGSDDDFRRFAAELRSRQMGMLLDVVPNHMCIATSDNWRWRDVLENGPSSAVARFFDIDWRPPKPELAGKVLLPVLGEQYGRMLESGVSVAYADGAFDVVFYESRLPLTPRSWTHLLEPALAELRRRFGDEEPRVLELESIMRAIGHLPARTEIAPAKIRERRHEREILGRRLSALTDGDEEVRAAVDASIRAINGVKGDPRSFDRLEALLGEQPYRLSHWRVAADEINYRRFFDINDLAAIRVEDPVVFAVVHELSLRLAREGIVTGFRIDHVDGLFDPEKYLLDLQRAFREAGGQAGAQGASCYVVVEKILAPREQIPSEWPVQGTTGYEFAALVSSVLVDATSAPRLRQMVARMAGDHVRFSDIVYASKRLVLRSAMSAELNVLARRLDRISEQHRYTRDFTLNSVHGVLTEVIASFPVYRTYIRPGDTAVSERDRRPIEVAVRLAKRRNPVTNESLFDFVRSVLLLEDPDGLSESQRAERRDFVLRFQQLTGPVMAKGLEDTAFYRYFPLAALNEVGGDPDAFGGGVEEFHRLNVERARLMPNGLSATATHDTKRGEDTRARLLALSEIPDPWAESVARWQEMNRPHRADVAGQEAPDGTEEYLLYQTLVGTWPAQGLTPEYRERIRQYLHKALLEAKVHTSWINHDEAYENAVLSFVEAVLDPQRSAAFLDDIARFQQRVARPGYWSSLSQVLLKIASPGVPDFYQGTELWDFSLVDPDNRRPVDFEVRRAHLEGLRAEAARDPRGLADRLMAQPEDGRIKMFVTMRALGFRREQQRLFQQGSYERLTISGKCASHAVAFARTFEGQAAVAAAGRHYARLGAAGTPPTGALWADTKLILPTALAGRRWRDTLTDRMVGSDGALPLAEVFAHLPVALLSPV